MESIHFGKLTHKEARNRWAEFDEWVDQNTPRNKNWEAEAAVAAAEAEARRQREESREKVLNERAEKLLGGSAMCVELRSNPAWSTLPTEIKNDMEDVERIVQRFGEAVKQEEEREKAAESGG
jgi:transketolase